MEKHKNIPQLRFTDFNGDWISSRLGNVFDLFNGYAFSSTDSLDNGIPWIKIADVGIQEMKRDNLSFLPKEFAEKYKKFLIRKGDFVIALTRPILNGKLKIAQADAFFNNSLLNQRVGKIVSKNSHYFIYTLLQNATTIEAIDNSIAGTDPPNLSTNELKTIFVKIPNLPEQQKIASFFTAIDQKTSQLKRKKTLLEQYKKGVMQKIFNQEIRFKDDKGQEFPKWDNNKLSEYLVVSRNKNADGKYGKADVLSVSGDFGIVNQIAFQGRSFAGESVLNYGVVETGDIVYTKSPLKENPYGIIKVNKGKIGIVSTLYAVYKCKDNALGEYFDFFFQLKEKLNGYLRPLVHKGAKNDMKINNERVLIDTLNVPRRKEQQKIVDFLNVIDEKINHAQKQIDKAEVWKKGLMQQMFV